MIIKNLNEENLVAKILTRLKNPLSIVIKMSLKEINIAQIDDIVGFRIIVKDLDNC